MERTIERTDAHRAWVREYKQRNEQLRCRVYECCAMREGLSRYCKTHANRAGVTGSATVKPCDQLLALNPLSKELAEKIKTGDDLPHLEATLLRGAKRVIPGGTSYVYKDRFIETGMKTADKARILLATAAHKHGYERVIAYGVLWAMAMELDRDTHSQADLKAYFRTNAGNDIATLADISKRWGEVKRTWKVDNCFDAGSQPTMRVVSEDHVQCRRKQAIRGAVKRKAAQLLFDTIARQLGPTKTWLSDAWASPYTAHIADKLGKAVDRLYPAPRASYA